MRESKTLKRFREGGCARVCGLGHYIPFYVRHAAHVGYDLIWLDLEHRAMSEREVQSLLTLCHYNDIDCMVRPPTREHSRLYRYIEDGATAVMMPLISDAATAQRIVNAVKFPPLGNRGLDGAGLDADYGLDVFRPNSTYTDDINRETFVVVQIETLDALENVDEIASVPGIDAFFVGPGDLGLRLGQVESDPQTALDAAIGRVAEVAREKGIGWGMPAGTPEQIAKLRGMGAQLLAYRGDFELTNVLKDSIQEFDKALGEAE